MPNFCCDNAEIVRKQREELILLTKDLKEQEIQLNSLHGNNLKQREKCKSLEKQKSDLEKVIKSKSSDIENLSNGVKMKLEEIEAFRQKLKEKDMYIQNQATKLIRIQAVSEKYSHEIANLKKINTDTKSENVKLNIKLKEQTIRILDLKETDIEQKKLLDSKNNLIQTSAEHIVNLEQKLKKLVEFMDQMKVKKLNQQKQIALSDRKTIESNLISQRSNSVSGLWVSEEPVETRVLNATNEIQLNEILQSLKETWLESNLKYEEVKNMIYHQFNDSKRSTKTETTLDKFESVSDISCISRMATSSPIHT